MRFHVLGVSFAPTNKEYSCEGFSQKVRLFCKMMTELGHTVYHYGIEGSNPICTENIDVVSKETYEKVHKAYDYKVNGFLYYSETEAQEEFNFNAIVEIQKRKQPNDFLCFSFGFPQKPIYEAHKDLISTEIGVGFDGSFTPFRVFESYAWMHTIYGKENRLQSPSFYDSVIPNYYDLDDYIYSEEKDDYFFFIARLDPIKGLEIALRSAEYVGSKLIVAGIGKPHLESPNLIHVGVVNFEQRARLMSKAKATFVPTNYIEPYGSTVVESLLCGTPVISTDFGAFTENVIHGRVGYRCRTLEQFFWATKNINNIKPIDCRNYAVENYSMSRIGKMYEEYFYSLYKLTTTSEGWYQKNLNRKNLNWLNKYIPEIYIHKEDNRPILCFLVGYTPDLFDINTKNNYGSEITLVKLAEQFSKKYRVLIFGDDFHNEKNINNIEYLNASKFQNFQNENNIEITIISRYMYHIIENEIKSEKIYIWVHDTNILPYYQGQEYPNHGIEHVQNILNKIDGIITLSNWHKKYFIDFYNIDNINKIFVIPSAIDTNMFSGNFKKQKNKFIWTSHGYRGIEKLLEYFHDIRTKIPDAELYIYRDITAFNENILEEMKKYDYFHYCGKLEHNKIPSEFESSEIWFYPTNFTETYCMSAVEAQMSKCVCVGTNIGALTETIGDRGVIINEEIWSDEYKEKAISEIVDILNNDERKKNYQEAGYKWAKEQTWENRANDWYNLFNMEKIKKQQ
jgi:glycosyltransferase involved in cell wall biosynthesis